MEWLRITRNALALLLCVSAGTTFAPGADSTALSNGEWSGDLNFLYRQMQAHHVNLYHTTAKASFDAAFASLQSRLPSLNSDQITVEFARFAALAKDGHSGILDFPSGNSYYPLRLHYFSDGLIVESTLPAHEALLGARLIGVNDTSVDDLFTMAAQLIGHDPGNVGLVQRFAPLLMVSSGVLHGLGVTPSADRAVFHFEKGNRTIAVAMVPEVPFMPLLGYAPNTGWVTLASPSSPLWLKNTAMNWTTYIPEHRAQYVAFNHVLDGQSQTLSAFFDRVFASIDANRAGKLVIDARLNNGGNNTLLAPIFADIRSRPAIAGSGHLFVIIGPYTYSAAQNFVNRLQRVAKPIFVGEPTGENVDSFGDPYVFVLPNSGLHFGMATRYWQDEPDNRVSTTPDIPASMSADDYAKGRDPALEAIWNTP